MPDGYVRIRAGEKRPVYGQVTAATGTLAIQGGGSAPTCTLYDALGAPVGTANQAATGFDSGAIAAPRAWFNVDTMAWVGLAGNALAAGYYSLVFKITALGSDAITRIYEPSVEIQVGAVA